MAGLLPSFQSELFYYSTLLQCCLQAAGSQQLGGTRIDPHPPAA
jgi:hypothetical protein